LKKSSSGGLQVYLQARNPVDELTDNSQQISFVDTKTILSKNPLLEEPILHCMSWAMATSPIKFSNTPVKFSQRGEDLCPPVITEFSTLQEYLSFLFLQQPQHCLLQEALKQFQEDMDIIKNESNPQFQALDEKSAWRWRTN